MNFTTPAGQLFWSRDAGSLRLDTDGAGCVHFSISCGSRSCAFDLVPVEGGCLLRLDELLESMLPDPELSLPSPVRVMPAARFDITADDGETIASWWCLAFRGGAGGSLTGRFLSWKSNPSPAWRGCVEPLSLLVESGHVIFSAIAYLQLQSPVTLTLAEVTVDAPSIVTIDASPDRIAALLEERDVPVDSIIRAYDVSATDTDPIRFIVHRKDARLTHFLFVNSLGVLDAIHASGSRRRSMEMVSGSFANRGIECELYNRSYGKMSVSTGNIADGRTHHQWMEFLCAHYRFLFRDDPERIVIDDISPETTDHEVSAISFTFHLSEEPHGWHFTDPELPPYGYPRTNPL